MTPHFIPFNVYPDSKYKYQLSCIFPTFFLLAKPQLLEMLSNMDRVSLLQALCLCLHIKMQPRMEDLAGRGPSPFWALLGPVTHGMALPVGSPRPLNLQWVLCGSHPSPCPRGSWCVLGPNNSPLSCRLHSPCEGDQEGRLTRGHIEVVARAGSSLPPSAGPH